MVGFIVFAQHSHHFFFDKTQMIKQKVVGLYCICTAFLSFLLFDKTDDKTKAFLSFLFFSCFDNTQMIKHKVVGPYCICTAFPSFPLFNQTKMIKQNIAPLLFHNHCAISVSIISPFGKTQKIKQQVASICNRPIYTICANMPKNASM